MIGFGVFAGALALAALWLHPQGRGPDRPGGSAHLALLAVFTMPFLANATGWIFTEMGRQPWIVAPNPTGDGNDPLPDGRGGLAVRRHRDRRASR